MGTLPFSDFLIFLLFSKFIHNINREVNKAALKSDPSQIVALKKIKDETETEGVSFFFRLQKIIDHAIFSTDVKFSKPSVILMLTVILVSHHCIERN
jgi:hypothetical protein